MIPFGKLCPSVKIIGKFSFEESGVAHNASAKFNPLASATFPLGFTCLYTSTDVSNLSFPANLLTFLRPLIFTDFSPPTMITSSGFSLVISSLMTCGSFSFCVNNTGAFSLFARLPATKLSAKFSPLASTTVFM